MEVIIKPVGFILLVITSMYFGTSDTSFAGIKTNDESKPQNEAIQLHRGRRVAGECGGTYSGTGGVLTSPGFPEDYSDYDVCFYVIEAPSNYTILISFRVFDTENGFDYLTVYDGPNVDAPESLRLSGTSIPEDFHSTTNKLYLIFESDDSVGGRGFYATYIASNDDISRIAHGLSVSVSGSYRYIQSVGGIVISHDTYPSSYHEVIGRSIPAYYSMTFLGLSPFDGVLIRFSHIDVYNSNPDGGCNDGDVVALRDDTIDLYRFCGDGSQTPMTVEVSFGTSLHFDVLAEPAGSYGGFRASYAQFYYPFASECHSRSEFRCNGGQCISRVLVCDGYEHCPDGSDEHGSACGVEEHKSTFHIWHIVGIVAVCLFFVYILRHCYIRHLSTRQQQQPAVSSASLAVVAAPASAPPIQSDTTSGVTPPPVENELNLDMWLNERSPDDRPPSAQLRYHSTFPPPSQPIPTQNSQPYPEVYGPEFAGDAAFAPVTQTADASDLPPPPAYEDVVSGKYGT
ncbi:bone morphogenetic protein 1-like [Ptychodera flava]|uniref:bone morphogenetic protein 1-like n=1 Tax=Ptychodera flava TaxID=63121 RepID=UPI00396A864E